MLEQLPYDENIEQEVFKEILDSLTFIEPKFTSREKYNTSMVSSITYPSS